MRQWKVNADVGKVDQQADFVGWQEIAPRRYRRAVGRLPSKVRFLNTPVPVSFPKDWVVLDTARILTHKGRRLVTPHRWIVVALLREKKTNKVFALVNTHYVSGAWNNKRKFQKEWRKTAWNHHHRLHRKVVRRLVNNGISVIGTGDFNRENVRKLNRRQKWLNNGRIDKIFKVNAPHGVRLRREGAGVENLHSDHNMLKAYVTIRKRKGNRYIPAERLPNFSDLKPL